MPRNGRRRASGSSDIDRRIPVHHWGWWFALAIWLLVAAAGFVLTCNQFFVNYLYDQNAHTRTLGGLLAMLLGLVGIFLPVLLIRNKDRFLSWRRPRRCLLAFGIPVLYVLVLILFLEASLRSTNLILPRPALPTAVLRYHPGDSRVEFRGRWGGGGGSNDAEMREGVEHFSSHIDQGFIKGFLPGAPHHPDRRLVTIVGRAKRTNPGLVQIFLDVDAEETFQFAVENLDKVKMSSGGKPVGNSVLQSGRYQIMITGRTKKDA